MIINLLEFLKVINFFNCILNFLFSFIFKIEREMDVVHSVDSRLFIMCSTSERYTCAINNNKFSQ